MERALRRLVWAAAAAMVLCSPTQARAEVFIGPWTGVVFGNDSIQSGPRGLGMVFGNAGGSIWGTETDLGLEPGIFGSATENYALDFMAGFSIGPTYRIGRGRRIRPYWIGEVGMLRASIDAKDNVSRFARSDWGFNTGGGVNIELGERLALRADGRYLRSFNGDPALNSLDVDMAHFHFYRVTIGIVLD